VRVLRHRQGAVRRLLVAALNSGSKRHARTARGTCLAQWSVRWFLSARVVHSLPIRRKRDCNAGERASPANCMQSDARRRHSKARFRENSSSDMAHCPQKADATIARHRASRRWSMPQKSAEKTSFGGCRDVSRTSQAGPWSNARNETMVPAKLESDGYRALEA
jgi:hypothetical protein